MVFDHGTAAGFAEGCRCTACVAAEAAFAEWCESQKRRRGPNKGRAAVAWRWSNGVGSQRVTYEPFSVEGL